MIYNVHWDSMHEQCVRAMWRGSFPNISKDDWEAMVGRPYALKDRLIKLMKETKDNSFVFIVTKDQYPSFEEFLDKNELKDLIIKETPFITNVNYPDQGPRLKLMVFQTKDHFQREEASDS